MKSFDYRHIIWDWNGTLFDDAWLCLDIVNDMLSRRGVGALTAERYEVIFDFPVQVYYERAGFDFAREPFEALSDEFIAAYLRRVSECELRAGARDVLAAFQSRGVTQSVLSAMWQESLFDMLERFGLRSYFDAINGLDNHHAAGKIEVGRRWLAAQHISPESMVLIGDTTHDFEVAQALGVACVQIHSGHHARERLAASGVRVINRLADLLA